MDGYKISHIGLDIDFYHDQSDQIKLPSETKNMYAIDKEQAGIFIETPSVVKYSSEEMLEWHLTHSKKTLAEHLPAHGSSDEESSRQAIISPIQFPCGTFHIVTEQGVVDIKALRMAIGVSV
jgi:hypothetical protein